ncbi:beta-ketoacyl-ACP synthase [Marinibactrum halimedae]|uniref:Beta-ketoacyl-ACP synthase II n=1 Tax=Marinibactrum halimedae TaxID=1444977 RepID=A0AA37WNG0_9GAMM|nr:beta-ketoacyl-ACP synthase [Marinibactrum halimedae]MCD9460444.1 beta-ketoacyl-ACP synthase [Marinibactrum halimedae]GLS27425.1 beta-ketoacyl-ACP synthase II [Marinibactrum halimedae]
MERRVVVTGMGAVTSLGDSWDSFSEGVKEGRSGIVTMPEWDRYSDLNTRLAGPIPNFEPPAHYSRKKTRTMGRIALISTRASEMALDNAGLLDDPILKSGEVGVAYGSSTGSPDAVTEFGSMLIDGNMNHITSTTYIRMMGHTTPVNIGLFFGLRGCVIPTSSACTSGSQGIGFAYERIKYGMQTIMVAGGAEELCPTEAAVFDILFATSTKNDTPKLTPSPFDQDRDGLVIGEGAATLILEEREHALARGAKIYAEIVGFANNSDGSHVTQPKKETMQIAMEMSLRSAGLDKSAIGYVNAHGTATDRGDIAESNATAALFGNNVPFSTLKGNLGHTLGACGSIEAWAGIHMMNEGWVAPTLNLKTPDEKCGDLDYVMGAPREVDFEYLMSNNFAFGGINTSLIFKKII